MSEDFAGLSISMLVFVLMIWGASIFHAMYPPKPEPGEETPTVRGAAAVPSPRTHEAPSATMAQVRP